MKHSPDALSCPVLDDHPRLPNVFTTAGFRDSWYVKLSDGPLFAGPYETAIEAHMYTEVANQLYHGVLIPDVPKTIEELNNG